MAEDYNNQHANEEQPPVCELVALTNQQLVDLVSAGDQHNNAEQPPVREPVDLTALLYRNPRKKNDEWDRDAERNWIDLFTYHARLAAAADHTVESSPHQNMDGSNVDR